METNPTTPAEWIALVAESAELDQLEKMILADRFNIVDHVSHRIESVATRYEVDRKTLRDKEMQAMRKLRKEFSID